MDYKETPFLRFNSFKYYIFEVRYGFNLSRVGRRLMRDSTFNKMDRPEKCHNFASEKSYPPTYAVYVLAQVCNDLP